MCSIQQWTCKLSTILHCDYIGCVVLQVKEGGMKRHVLCLTSVFSFSVHITKLSKIRTYLKAMVNTKKILKSSLHTKIYVQQAFFLFSMHSTKLSDGEYKKVVTTKN